MTVTPKQRRPDQNTGRRAKVALHVEEQACEMRGWGAFSNDPGNHQLYNDTDAVTRCWYCTLTWVELDLALNGERGVEP
jgi:hypothetical protein